MRGAVTHAPGDVRGGDVAEPAIVELTDAVTRLAATGICGSPLRRHRGLDEAAEGYRAMDERRATEVLQRP